MKSFINPFVNGITSGFANAGMEPPYLADSLRHLEQQQSTSGHVTDWNLSGVECSVERAKGEIPTGSQFAAPGLHQRGQAHQHEYAARLFHRPSVALR